MTPRYLSAIVRINDAAMTNTYIVRDDAPVTDLWMLLQAGRVADCHVNQGAVCVDEIRLVDAPGDNAIDLDALANSGMIAIKNPVSAEAVGS